MNRIFTRIVGCFIHILLCTNLAAQCPGGYTQSELNWDHLDFLPSNNTRYSSFYPSAAFPYTQNFAMGTRSVNFIMAPAATLVLNGENSTNTAHAGSHANAGDDIHFTTTAASDNTITVRFDDEVANLRFSLFDLDNGQRITITAVNAGGAAQVITLENAAASSGITLSGSGSTTVIATGPAMNYADNDNNGTLNIGIDGPMIQFVITLNGAAGDIWLSDLKACVGGAFPDNYQQVSRPFTGQPQYVLAVVNNNVYYVDPNSGRGYHLFREPGHDRLNSMAYDPYRREVWYTYSLTDRVGLDPRNDKALKKYSVDNKTISVVIPNVNTFGIPTYESGVESGAASFYNGSLYLGIEGYTGTSGSGSYAAGRKSTIWKISFDEAGNPIAPAVQVFGITADNGTDAQNIHDWSDFAISNGILYDFDGSNSGDIDFYHFNLMTGQRIEYDPVGVDPKQVAIGWDEKLYDVDARLALYNGVDRVTAPFTITAPLGPAIPSNGSWGDAAGPYRPFLDFGDAPASYDPDPLSPACHDTLTPNVSGRRTRMRLGADEDVEWLKRGFTTVEDNFEDGLAFVPLYTVGSYLARVSVFNNTGRNARVCAWLDFNGNGIFDPGEGITPINVASSNLTRTVDLVWPNAPSSIPNGGYTYLRIRITDAAFGMGVNNATGYYSMGEVEDYLVRVENFTLPVHLLSFDAKVANPSAVDLDWSVAGEDELAGYDIQRSADGLNWESIAFVPTTTAGVLKHHRYTDGQALQGRSFYRLRLHEKGGPAFNYSAQRMVAIQVRTAGLSLRPNPASNHVTLSLEHGRTEAASLRITGMQGTLFVNEGIKLQIGVNTISVPLAANWPPGHYVVQIITGNDRITQMLVIGK